MLVEDLKLPTIHNKSRDGLLKTNGCSFLSATSSTKYKETYIACRKVYAQRLSRSRSSKRSAPRKQEAQSGTHVRTNTVDEKAETTKVQPPAKKPEVQNLLYANQKAASDLIELQRDLATYDHNLFLKTPLRQHLEAIQSICTGMASLDMHFEHHSGQAQDISKVIAASLRDIASLSPQQSCGRTGQAESYAMKRPADFSELDPVYQGAVCISGQECLAGVKASEWALHFSVHCCLGFAGTYTHPIRMPKTRPELVQQAKALLSQLRFEAAAEGGFVLQLESNPPPGHRWVLVQLRDLGLCSVHMVANEAIDVSISQHGLYLTVPYIENFEDLRLSSLRKYLSKHLHWQPSTSQLTWAEVNPLHSKEERSILMNEAYVREAVADINYTYCLSFSTCVDGQDVRVDVAKSEEEVAFTLTCGERSVQVDRSSKLCALLQELQGLKPTSQVTTLCQSLEFEYVVRKLFRTD